MLSKYVDLNVKNVNWTLFKWYKLLAGIILQVQSYRIVRRKARCDTWPLLSWLRRCSSAGNAVSERLFAHLNTSTNQLFYLTNIWRQRKKTVLTTCPALTDTSPLLQGCVQLFKVATCLCPALITAPVSTFCINILCLCASGHDGSLDCC